MLVNLKHGYFIANEKEFVNARRMTKTPAYEKH
jgi:hypothetical protein